MRRVNDAAMRMAGFVPKPATDNSFVLLCLSGDSVSIQSASRPALSCAVRNRTASVADSLAIIALGARSRRLAMCPGGPAYLSALWQIRWRRQRDSFAREAGTRVARERGRLG